LFNEKICDEVLPHLTWIKVSIDAAKADTYAKIHRTRSEDFGKVIKNMTHASKMRKNNGYHCTLGMQIVLLPDNYKEVVLLAKKASAIGMDYLVVKPYSQHPLSKTKIFKNIKYGRYLDLSEKLKKLNNEHFNVVFRMNTMKKWDDAERNYKHCLALPFWAYIDSGGNVYACSIYLTKNKFCLGNIYKSSFKEIWESKKRDDLVCWAAKELNTAKCRVNCRMDEVNRYLWDLTHPSEHINFV
jgi:radical SAM protein with 4Fe4S-binding SPASM domain